MKVGGPSTKRWNFYPVALSEKGRFPQCIRYSRVRVRPSTETRDGLHVATVCLLQVQGAWHAVPVLVGVDVSSRRPSQTR